MPRAVVYAVMWALGSVLFSVVLPNPLRASAELGALLLVLLVILGGDVQPGSAHASAVVRPSTRPSNITAPVPVDVQPVSRSNVAPSAASVCDAVSDDTNTVADDDRRMPNV